MTEIGAKADLETAAGVAGPLPTAAPPQQQRGHLEAVVRGGSLNLFGAVVNSGLSVALVVVIARGFSPAVAGSFWSATSLFLFLQQVGNLGIATGVVYFLPRQRVQRRIADLRYI